MRRGYQGSPRKGFSLVEVAVYSAILLALMGGVYSVVEGGSRYFRLAEAQETVSQQAMIAMNRVKQELSNATQTAVLVDTVPQDYLLFLSPFKTTPPVVGRHTFSGSQMQWWTWVGFYQNNQNQLVRAELDPVGSPFLDASTAVPPDFATEILPITAKPVAQNVKDVSFSFPAWPETAVVRVVIETEKRTASDKTSNVRLVSSVRMTN